MGEIDRLHRIITFEIDGASNLRAGADRGRKASGAIPFGARRARTRRPAVFATELDVGNNN